MRPLLPWIAAGLVAGGVSASGQTLRGTNRIALTNLNRAKVVSADGKISVATTDTQEIRQATEALEKALAARRAEGYGGNWKPVTEFAGTALLRRWAVTGPEAEPKDVTLPERHLRSLCEQVFTRSAVAAGDLYDALLKADEWIRWAADHVDRAEAERAKSEIGEWPREKWAGSAEELALFFRLTQGTPKPGDAELLKKWDEEDVLTFWGKTCVILHYWKTGNGDAGPRFRELRDHVAANANAVQFLSQLRRDHDPAVAGSAPLQELLSLRDQVLPVQTVSGTVINRAVKAAQVFQQAWQDRLDLGWTGVAALKPEERQGFAAIGLVYLMQKARLGRVVPAARELSTVEHFGQPEEFERAKAIFAEMPLRRDWKADADRKFFEELIALKTDPKAAVRMAATIFNERPDSFCGLVASASALLLYGQATDVSTVLGKLPTLLSGHPEAKELVNHLEAVLEERKALDARTSSPEKELQAFRARVAPELGRRFNAALQVKARWPAVRLKDVRDEISLVEAEQSAEQTLNLASQVNPGLSAEQKRRSAESSEAAAKAQKLRLATLRAEQMRLEQSLGWK